MKATELLKKQHHIVEDLFKKLEAAKAKKTKAALFEKLASSLCGHDAIEREIFYPACEKALGLTDMLGEALVEHGLVEFSLHQANQALGADDFDFKITVLKEVVEHHVKEEEADFFPKVEKALGSELLETLGVRMEARFAKAVATDFRGPLAENLRQVLRGEIKPKPQRRAARRAA